MEMKDPNIEEINILTMFSLTVNSLAAVKADRMITTIDMI